MNEKMKILIAYDGSDCSKEAIRGLRRAGLPRDTEVLVVSVSDAALPLEPATPGPNSLNVPHARVIAYEIEARVEEARAQALRAVEEAHKLAEEAVQQLKSDFPAWDVRAEAMAGTPAPAVIKEADDWNVDLIVLGTHGRSALGRLLMGSVSQKVAAEAHCSVRVSRYPVEKSDSPIRIVVGVDGSLSALAAVREVALRAWPAGSEALVIAANYREPSGIVLMPSAAPKPALERTTGEETLSPQNMIEIAGEDLRAVAGLNVLSEIMEGDPKSVLISEAKTFDADCIFVGCRDSNSRLERHMLGSVSAAVANGAHCSVEVVRARRTPGVS
jgi:nucleotide-binding universal stress UspA family protein